MKPKQQRLVLGLLALVAVAGSGLNELDMTLRRGSATLGEDNALTGYPVVRFCATANGPHQVGIRSVAGSGDFVFRVFRQQSPEPAAATASATGG